MIRKMIFGVLLFVAGTSMSMAADLFSEGKPLPFTRGYPFDAGTTIGGYPIFKGDGRWVLGNVWDKAIPAANSTNESKLGFVRLDQVEPSGQWIAVQFVGVATQSSPRAAYVNGSPCGGTHMVAVNRASGWDDNCLAIDAKKEEGESNAATFFDVVITQTRSGDRRYLMRLRLNAEWLGFHDTKPEDWNYASVLQASPDRAAFVEKLKKWASQLQIASENAIDYSKPQNVFDGIPSFRTLKSMTN